MKMKSQLRVLTDHQALVAANRELITRFEQKIQSTLARIWGEEPACSTGEST